MPAVLISPTSFGIVLSRILNHYYFFFFIVSNLQFYRFFLMMKWLDIFFHFSFFSWRAANFSLIFERFFFKFWGAQNCGNWFKTVRDRAGSWLDGNPTIEKVLIERCKHFDSMFSCVLSCERNSTDNQHYFRSCRLYFPFLFSQIPCILYPAMDNKTAHLN